MPGLKRVPLSPRSSRLFAAFVVVSVAFSWMPLITADPANAQEFSSFSLIKYYCAPGYDPGFGTANDAFANCPTPAEGVHFQLTTDDPAYPASDRTTDQQGAASWTDIPANIPYVITETIPPGYGIPWIYCSITGNPNNPGDVQESFFQAVDSGMNVGITDPSLAGYTQATCYWFNVPGGVTTVTVEKRFCPGGSDPGALSLQDLESTCTAAQDVSFIVNNDLNTEKKSDSSGRLTFENVPTGLVKVHEPKQQGYEPARVFCQSHPASEANVVYQDGDEQSLIEQEGAWYVQLSVPVDDKIDCIWFNNADGDAGGSVTIVKYACSFGYDEFATVDQLNADCVKNHGGVNFAVGLEEDLSVAATDDTGMVTFSGIPYGPIAIREQQPSGYATIAVFCYPHASSTPGYTVSEDARQSVQYDQAADTYTAHWDFQPDTGLICVWYNVALTADDVEPGKIVLRKVACPEGYDPSQADLATIVNDCSAQEGVRFDIEFPGVGTVGGDTDSAGVLVREDLKPGPLVITETPPPGYQLARVFCHPHENEASNFDTALYNEYFESNPNQVESHLEAGYTLDCVWVNVPSEDEYGTVYAYKYNCPSGLAYEGATRDYFAQSCTETPDIHFSLDVETPPFHEEWLVSPEGMAVFDQVPAGPFSLTEEPSIGFSLVAVFCGTTEQNNASLPSGWERVTSEDGLDYHVESGQYIHCEFYNIPDTHMGTIVITKYLCGELAVQIGSELDYDVFSQQCTELGQGYDFRVETSDGVISHASDSSGRSIFSGLGALPVKIVEYLPPEQESYAVYCSTDPATSPYTEYAGEQVSSFEYTVVAGETLYCSWFNYVPPTNTYVEVVKYICPAGYDIAAAGYEDLISSCTTTGSQVPFRIDNGDGFESQKSTDDQGAAVWTNVPPSLVGIKEMPTPAYLPVKVYCSVTPEGGQAGVFQGYDLDGVNHFIEIGVNVNSRLTCHWFNAPAPERTVIVQKWICTGIVLTRGEPSLDEMKEACTQPGEAFTFLLGDAPVDQATTGPDGKTSLNAGADGVYSLTEEPKEGYRSGPVFCSRGPDDLLREPEEQPVNISLNEGDVVTCDWFNAVAHEETTIEAGSILIHKFLCPPGFQDISSGGRSPGSSYYDYCLTPMDGVAFNAEQNGANVGSGETDSSGETTIASLPVGTLRISELPREGYSQPYVECASFEVGLSRVLVSYEPQSMDNWGHSIALTDGYAVDCYWFNIPASSGQPGAPIQIIVHKYLCPADTDPSAATYESLSTDCSPEEGVNFDVTGGDGIPSGGPTDANGYAEYNGVASGPIILAETPRDGYSTTAVFCTVYVSSPGSPNSMTITDSTLPYYLADGYKLECHWFNGATVDYGNVTVFKYICHEDFDYELASREDLSQNCTEQYEGIPYFLSGPNGYAEERSTSLFGLADWTEVPAGSYSMHETPASGYYPVRIYCAEAPIGSPLLYETGFEGQFEDYTASPDNILDIQLEVRAGYWWFCEWFNAPVDGQAWVDIIKYVCPTGYDASLESQDELRHDCLYVAEGVDFTLTGASYSEERTTDSDGRASWEDVPIETLTLGESSEVLTPVRIFCTFVEGEDAEPPSLPWNDYSGVNEIKLDFDAGYRVYCEWFNDSDVGTLKIYKYFCEEGVEPPKAASRDDYFAACGNPQEGVHFDVKGQWGFTGQGDTDQTGLILFDLNVPDGPVTMTETPPDGFIAGKVFCWTLQSEVDTPGKRVAVTIDQDFSATFPVTANAYVTCEWYDIPYEEVPPQVWIQKYNCPAAADWSWSYHQLISSCHEPGSNVEFGIGSDPGALSLSVTDAQGRIILGDLEPGTLYVKEPLPNGYAGVVVYCQFVSENHAGEYQRADVYDQAIQLHLDYGYVITCVWFDFLSGYEPPHGTPPAGGATPLQPITTGGNATGLPPVEPNTPATLIITKYTCPDGYDLHSEDADPELDCEDLTNDIQFTLDDDDEDEPPLERVTGEDEDGVAEFSGLAPGPYLLQEELPEGTLSAFIYTCESDRREFQEVNPFTPFAYAGPDGRLGVTLEPGETLECSWYDIPEDLPGGEVTVIKYSCPGALVIVAQCEVFPGGVTIGLTEVGGDDTVIELVTGEDGTAVAQLEGVYAIQEIPINACLIDSEALDLEGNLVVGDGDVIEVRVYNCGT